MAKTETPKTKKPRKVKVVFYKAFEGALNNDYFKQQPDDELSVLPHVAEWLKNKGVAK